MSKNVVYILGAGFSAPLGLPLMRDFIAKAQRLKRDNPQYKYFEKVIDLLKGTRSAGDFFEHDSKNIEEALSLLEMKDNFKAMNQKEELIKFIIDVINASTPPRIVFDTFQMSPGAPSEIFTKDQLWQGYCGFVASLAGLEFFQGPDYTTRGVKAQAIKHSDEYSVISLNYDLVLENVAEFIHRTYRWGRSIPFQFNRDAGEPNSIQLLKIHGSVDTGNIIPPTFNKGLYGSELPQSWRDAYKILANATEIRVIGYSLPQTDSYLISPDGLNRSIEGIRSNRLDRPRSAR